MIRLFFYYAWHSFVNSVKKLFRTWVAIVIAVSLVIGIAAGIGAGVIAGIIEDSAQSGAQYEESAAQADAEEEITDEPMTEEEKAAVKDILEIAAGGIVFILILAGIWTADKSGTSIFLMPDVNMLFPSPNKPQSVLMYKTVMQAGVIIVSSVYLVFQLPNLIMNAGLDVKTALVLLAVWALSLLLMKLISVFCYTVTATRPNSKKYLQYAVYGAVAAAALLYIAKWQLGGCGKFEAARSLFASEVSRYIPVWGWLKGMIMFAYEDRWLAVSACFAGMLAVFLGFIYLIWHIQADFYEDAMNSAQRMQERLEAQKEGRRALSAKPRSKRIDREREFKHGRGASVFFAKTMYNRFRFAGLGVFTKTSSTYLIVSLAAAALLRFLTGYREVLPVAGILAFFIVFRTLGNPIAEETSKNFIFTVPERAFSKVFYCTVSGSANTALDLIPAFIAAEGILLGNPLNTVCYLVLLTTLDWLASSAGTFISLAIPSSVHKAVISMFQLSSVMISVLPTVAAAVMGLIFGNMYVYILAASVINAAAGLGLSAISSTFIHEGVK